MGVILGLKRAACLGAALLLCACPSDEGAPPAPIEEVDGDVPRFDSGTRNDAGRDGASEGGEGGADAQGDAQGDGGAALGPVIELLEPEADSVIVGGSLSARCRVERSPDGEPVNPASVKIALYADGETVAFVTQVANATGDADVFAADVSLAAAPHGTIRMECSADDITTSKHHSALSLWAMVDRGPLISFLSPTADSFVKGNVSEGEDARIRFKVEPQPLSGDDTGAAIDDISVTVNGKQITGIEESATEEYVYSFGLDFGDPAFFTVVPDTLSVRVNARNVRTPAGSALNTLSVGVDGDGPEIVVIAPVGLAGAEPIVSGKVDVVLDIQDDLAGVDATSVEMKVSGRSYPVNALGNGRYGSSFEVGEFPNTADLTLNFTAKDKNGIATTASQGIRIDDQPPWVSLTPGPVRELVPKTTPPDECSGAFDPLGDAADDGQIVQKAVLLRALAWDRARQVSGQGWLHYSMVDQTSVDLVLQHDTSVPLLINSRGEAGGPCDAINLEPVAGGSVPVVRELKPLTPAGATPLGADLSSEPNVLGLCVGKTGSPPPELCFDPDLRRVIKHAVPGSFPVVYGINVTSSICTGDYYSNPTPGPVCIVAQARDNAGNTAFSAPIRLCVEYADDEDNVVSCPAGALDDITCTDGCVLPVGFGPNAPDRMPSVLRQN